jgi:hypothetical protein
MVQMCEQVGAIWIVRETARDVRRNSAGKMAVVWK